MALHMLGVIWFNINQHNVTPCYRSAGLAGTGAPTLTASRHTCTSPFQQGRRQQSQLWFLLKHKDTNKRAIFHHYISKQDLSFRGTLGIISSQQDPELRRMMRRAQARLHILHNARCLLMAAEQMPGRWAKF